MKFDLASFYRDLKAKRGIASQSQFDEEIALIEIKLPWIMELDKEKREQLAGYLLEVGR